MYYGKFWLGLLLISGAAAPLAAQWGPDSTLSPQWGPDSTDNDSWARCNDILVRVQDGTGADIMGASVTTDTDDMQVLTDSRGMAAIPCHSVSSSLARVEVSAPGYRTATMPLMVYGGSYLNVRLEKRQVAVAQERTISAKELSPSVQAESQKLQKQAEKALEGKDYGTAEGLLLKAEKLTPSAASVLNNLGICALAKNDLNNAASWFEKAAHAAPFKSDIVGNLGLVRWMQHRDDESYTLLTKAASMGYETGIGHYILGTVGLQKGMAKQAAEHLKKAPSDRFPYRDLYLSIALRNAGKTRAADESYRNFLKQHPVPYARSILPKVSG